MLGVLYFHLVDYVEEPLAVNIHPQRLAADGSVHCWLERLSLAEGVVGMAVHCKDVEAP
jgi:hypothetical protein